MKAAAGGVRPVSLELGGKNAAIVFADADMNKAIEGTMRSVFAKLWPGMPGDGTRLRRTADLR